MIQILATKLCKNKKKKKQFIVQFSISIIALSIFFSFTLLNKINLIKEQRFSNDIYKNYKIYKLYAENSPSSYIYNDYDIIGNISIPKLNINYPIFYGINDELLKLSPCRFYGDMPGKKSNLCIAGHNYNDDRFFSKLSTLEYGDEIIIENNSQNSFVYYVYKNYEVTEDSLQSVVQYSCNSCELTLVTCNNFNNNRIIIKAKTESLE